MFEERTYEALVKRALSRVAPTLDKREGSMVFNGVAPSMAELAQLYIGLDFVFQATYLLTAPRAYLIKRAEDRDLHPYPASAAVYRAEFNREVPAGTRFSCDDLNFVVQGRMDPQDDTPTGLSHRVVCETPGSAGSHYAGRLIPVTYLDGLNRAELMELLIPGDDEEETEVFRQRVLDSLQAQAFGGNQVDYRKKVLAIPGVSAVKVHPVWNGRLRPASMIPNEAVETWYRSAVDALPPAVADWLTAVYTAASQKMLTVGGSVKLVILAAENTVPTASLLEEIQTRIDPTQNAGEGMGLAPIGHVVHVVGAAQERVDITLHLTYCSGWNWASAKSYIASVIDQYFAELSKAWATSEVLTVRISQIESRILSSCQEMIADLGGTELNGREYNLALPPDSIPVRGDLHG